MMKLFVKGLIALALGLGSFCSQTALADSLTPEAQVLSMRRGVNVLGYDPLWKDASKARFKAKHFETLRQGGFDTVRFNLHVFDKLDGNLTIRPDYFKTLDPFIKEALSQGLTVIIDVHDFNECATDVPNCRIKLKSIWRQFGEHYKEAPPQLVFEILNEPNRAIDPFWNEMLAETLNVIRETNPDRNVIVGPNSWNNLSRLDQLQLPEADRHLIVTFHYYTPMEFTHQGAPWTPENTSLGVTWGTAGDRALLNADFDKVEAWSKAHNRPIFLGEFGAYDRAPMESRVAYTDAVARLAESKGWAWSYWQFDSDFIVYDIDKSAWVDPIHEALIPVSGKPQKPANDDISQQIINAPQVSNWSLYGGDSSLKIGKDSKVQGGAIITVSTTSTLAQPWDRGLINPVTGNIKKGDLLVIACWARLAPKDKQETVSFPAIIGQADAPYAVGLQGAVTISHEWTLVKVSGKAQESFKSKEANMVLQIGQFKGDLQLGPAFVLNLGPSN